MPGPHDAEQASGEVADEAGQAGEPQVPEQESCAVPAAPSGDEPGGREPGGREPGEPASRYEPL